MSKTYVLKNEELTAVFSERGAELTSVLRGDCEYIWQGDPAYWKGSAPMLFPICGQLANQKYTWNGMEYKMPMHGFMHRVDFHMVDIADDYICFELEANAATRAIYPFEFRLTVSHLLQGSCIFTQVTIANPDETVTLPATFGAHPGFNIPLEGKGAFSDYYLEFGEVCSPDLIEVAESGMINGRRSAYPLVDGKRISLSHRMFDNNDGVFLVQVDKSITLKSDRSNRSVTVTYPDMPYLGLWHATNSDAPYLCIEPWCGMPNVEGVSEDFATRPDMFRILPGGEKTVALSISFD